MESIRDTAVGSQAHADSHQNFPDSPSVTIEANRSWVALDLRALWTYRELLYFLTLRDVKVRYKQTAMGAAWAILQPLFAMLIFTLFFGKLARIPSDGIPYPLFAYAGLLPWTFFSNAINNSGNSLITNTNLITKVYFPRMIIPAAAVGAGLVDLAIAFLVLVGLMIYYDVDVTTALIALPFLVFLTAMLAVGVGMWLSALNVKYRDIRHALPFLIQLWMFVSPVIFPSSMVPQKWRWLLLLNPLTGIIDGFRAALFGRPFPWLGLATSSVITLLVLIFSAFSFRRMERKFADLI